MTLPERSCLLRIFIGESDRHGGHPLYEWLVLQAKKRELAGATVLRGIMGFGKRSRIHSSKIVRLSTDLPIVVEIVDTEEKVEAFLRDVEELIPDGLATIENVRIRFYRGQPDPDDA
jgi:uncharacterized protein